MRTVAARPPAGSPAGLLSSRLGNNCRGLLGNAALDQSCALVGARGEGRGPYKQAGALPGGTRRLISVTPQGPSKQAFLRPPVSWNSFFTRAAERSLRLTDTPSVLEPSSQTTFCETNGRTLRSSDGPIGAKTA